MVEDPAFAGQCARGSTNETPSPSFPRKRESRLGRPQLAVGLLPNTVILSEAKDLFLWRNKEQQFLHFVQNDTGGVFQHSLKRGALNARRMSAIKAGCVLPALSHFAT